MNKWINNQIDKASWVKFIVTFVLLFAYSYWAFVMPGPWTRVLAAAGTGSIPEVVPGFPEGLAVAAYAKLSAANLLGDYSLFQLIDIPYAILNFAMQSAIIALALNRFNLGQTPLRFALLLPAIYLFAEFIENPLLVILAKGSGEPANLVTAQQIMTSMKWIASLPSLLIGLISLIALIITAAISRFGKKSA